MNRRAALSLCTLLLIAGCPQAAEQPAELGPVINTTITPGAYTGDVTLTLQTLQDGVAVDEQQSTQTVTETIGDSGLPIIPTVNSPPRENLVLSSQESGLTIEQRVDSVAFADGRLVIVLETSIGSPPLELTGQETVTYEIIDADTLAYTSELSVSSPEIGGRSGGVAWQGGGTLRRQ